MGFGKIGDDGIFGVDWDGDGKVDAWDDAVSDHMLSSFESEEDDDDDDDDDF